MQYVCVSLGVCLCVRASGKHWSDDGYVCESTLKLFVSTCPSLPPRARSPRIGELGLTADGASPPMHKSFICARNVSNHNNHNNNDNRNNICTVSV